MAHSFSTIDSLSVQVDYSTYGVSVLGMSLPVIPEPITETVNLPAKVGGYTYVNVYKPAVLTLDCMIVRDNNVNLMDAFYSIQYLLNPLETFEILIDGIDHYWNGRRISGANASIIGGALNAAEFTLVFACDDPTAYQIVEGT